MNRPQLHITESQRKFLEYVHEHTYAAGMAYGTDKEVIRDVIKHGTYVRDGMTQALFNKLRDMYLEAYKEYRKKIK